jgi:torulene dioxygenase
LDLSATPPDYKVFVINNEGVGRVLATITDAPPAYVHSIFSTENYVLLIVWQADIGHTAKPTYNLLDTLKPWNPERDTIFCKS